MFNHWGKPQNKVHHRRRRATAELLHPRFMSLFTLNTSLYPMSLDGVDLSVVLLCPIAILIKLLKHDLSKSLYTHKHVLLTIPLYSSFNSRRAKYPI